MNPAQLQMQAKLVREGLIGKPADRIINRPGAEVWQLAGNADAMFRRLNENFHWYGRNGAVQWTWQLNSGGVVTGKELVSGQVTATNCGSFNSAVRWVAEHICGIVGARASFTQANDYFITRTQCMPFDQSWVGSVRTLTHDFAQTGAFFFKGHSWSQFNGQMYDATTNTMGFQQKTDLYWCDLCPTRDTRNEADRAFLIVAQPNLPHVPPPGPPPYACVSSSILRKLKHLFPIVLTTPGAIGVTQGFINALPPTSGNGHWPTYLVVSRDHLPPEFRQNAGPM